MTRVVQEEDDPYSVLIMHAYVFCGLKINQICDIFVISGRNGIRKASREYIRQKIVSIFQKIAVAYEESSGRVDLSPLYRHEEEHLLGSKDGRNKIPIVTNYVKEEDYGSEEDLEYEKSTKSHKIKKKATTNPRSKRS